MRELLAGAVSLAALLVLTIGAVPALAADPAPFASSSGSCDPGTDTYSTSRVIFPPQDRNHPLVLARLTTSGAADFAPNEDWNSYRHFRGGTAEMKGLYGPGTLWTLRDPIKAGDPVQALVGCNQPLNWSAQLFDVPTVPTSFAGATPANPDGSPPTEFDASEVAFRAPRAGNYLATVAVTNGTLRFIAPGAIPRTIVERGSVNINVDRPGTVPILLGAVDGPRPTWSVKITPAPTYPAKVQVRRASVLDGRLDVLADVSDRMNGEEVVVTFLANGEGDRFTASVMDGRLRFKRRLPWYQRGVSTGILTLKYAGNKVVRPFSVRLRAANGKARLSRSLLSLQEGRLRAEGKVTERAQGVVRLGLSYDRPSGGVGDWAGRATIRNGRWSLSEVLPLEARQGGYLTIQFTGELEDRIRGEQIAKQLLAGQRFGG